MQTPVKKLSTTTKRYVIYKSMGPTETKVKRKGIINLVQDG